MKNKIIIFAFILASIFAIQTNAKTVSFAKDQKGILGNWQLKKTNSAKTSYIPTIFKPETLNLAADEESNEITINEGFKDFVQTQTLKTDGTFVTKNTFNFGKVTAKAIWNENGLKLETVTEKGDRIVETFELSANKKELFVTVNLLKKGSANAQKVRRVFQRVDAVDETTTAQIGITDLNF